ncbi:Fic family protein [Rhodomicrobium sp. Az07]|uniref:Fic family protein n=1 Tax=Rhodomicrobium sp. Az07 TaxID=2839034 RepID=UPI001BE6E59B|nr:Fic family protein [Rhodomicrobium sp. Az07]MBT3071446.1 Fic family protein [Rhodomicrobium sp. Az07]
MVWNWQQDQWPQFSWRPEELEGLEKAFLKQSGVLIGAYFHVDPADKDQLAIDLMSNEALKTSQIEGEILDRESLQQSIRRDLGLATLPFKAPPAEQGISRMMVTLYRTFGEPLSAVALRQWHAMLMNGRVDIQCIGRYRTDPEPMQVVSGRLDRPEVHFEAPPAGQLSREMARFIRWFNETAPDGKKPLPPVTRAGLAHLHFVSVHPFEDGNGRIARALADKALAQGLEQPSLSSLSQVIQKRKKDYYDALARNNRELDITDWLVTFGGMIVDAQAYTETMIRFLIEKTRLYDRIRGQLNPRQEKALARMFREGPDGFTGGLSVGNYISITGTSRATATRDLQELVALGALIRTGEMKSTRYHLPAQLQATGT